MSFFNVSYLFTHISSRKEFSCRIYKRKSSAIEKQKNQIVLCSLLILIIKKNNRKII